MSTVNSEEKEGQIKVQGMNEERENVKIENPKSLRKNHVRTLAV